MSYGVGMSIFVQIYSNRFDFWNRTCSWCLRHLFYFSHNSNWCSHWKC